MRWSLVLPLAGVLGATLLLIIVVAVARSSSGGDAARSASSTRPPAPSAGSLSRVCDILYKRPPSHGSVEARAPDTWLLSSGRASPEAWRLVFFVPSDQSAVAVDVRNGKIVSEQYASEASRAAVQPYLASVRLSPLDPATAPWPYTDLVTASRAPGHGQDFSWRTPDPMSGLEAQFIYSDGIGMQGHTLTLQNCRSQASTSTIYESGSEPRRVAPDFSRVAHEDIRAFKTFFEAVQPW